MYMSIIKVNDEFILSDPHCQPIGRIVLLRRKGQWQIGIDVAGLKITKQHSQDEVKDAKRYISRK